MNKTITIDDIYTAINPLPAMLTEKGKRSPAVDFQIEANAGFSLCMKWTKRYAHNDWDREYKTFLGNDFHKLVDQALTFQGSAQRRASEASRVHGSTRKTYRRRQNGWHCR